MIPFRAFLFAVQIAALGLMHAAAAPVPGPLAERGVTPAAYDQLVAGGHVSPSLRADEPGCGHSDALTFGDKAIMAETVVKGRIAEVEYLYVQGGPFRTAYRIEAHETWKGAPVKQTWVLSKYGPNRRDHRRWKHDPRRIVLQAGDEGVFLLEGRRLRSRLDQAPGQARAFLADKVEFVNETQGVYLFKGKDPDSAFLANSGKAEKALTASAMRTTLAAIDASLKNGGTR